MNEDDRVACARSFRVAQPARRRFGKKIDRTLVLFIFGCRRNLESSNIGVYFRVGHIRRRKNSNQRLDRIDLTDLSYPPPQDAAIGGLHGIGYLVGLDIQYLLANRNDLSLIDVPSRKRALFHGKAPFRHDEWLNFLAHHYLKPSWFCGRRQRSRRPSVHKSLPGQAKTAPAYAAR